MPDDNRVIQRTASVEDRVDAIQALLDERGMKATEAVEELSHLAEDVWVPRNGARVVAKAWVDPAFRKRLLADGRAAVAELGLPMPKHHRHLVVLENTPTVQNVICCTQCSCTAYALHRAADAAPRNHRLAGREAGRHRDARFDDRRRAPVASRGAHGRHA